MLPKKIYPVTPFFQKRQQRKFTAELLRKTQAMSQHLNKVMTEYAESLRNNGKTTLLATTADEIQLLQRAPEELAAIKSAILREFDGSNHRELAKKFRVSTQHVYATIKHSRRVAPDLTVYYNDVKYDVSGFPGIRVGDTVLIDPDNLPPRLDVDRFGFAASAPTIGQYDSPLEYLGLGWIMQESDSTLRDLIRLVEDGWLYIECRPEPDQAKLVAVLSHLCFMRPLQARLVSLACNQAYSEAIQRKAK